MLNTVILVIGIIGATLGVSVAIWSILDTRRRHREPHVENTEAVDKTAAKVYLALNDLLLSTHSGRLPSEIIDPFDTLSEDAKNKYREVAKRHFH